MKPTTMATARRTAKNNMFILTNNNLARAPRYIVHFLAVVARRVLHHHDMKLPKFTSPLYGVDEHNTKIVTFLDSDRYGPKEDFAKIYQIK